MARKRSFSTFNLSFLDIMSCGFGAVVLIFLMIDHAANVHSQQVNEVQLAEVKLLEEEVLEGKNNLVRVRNTIAETDQQMAEAQGLANRIIKEVEESRLELAFFSKDTLAQKEHLNQLKSDLQSLEEEKKRLQAEGEKKKGEKIRQVIGDGDRQYLTGLKLGGNRTLVLLDASASMLDHSIVNIIRRRNMSDQVKLNSPKWQRALETVNWLTSQFPVASWYQIYTFNTGVKAAIPGSEGEWLEIKDIKKLETAVSSLRKLVPEQGTSLENLFLSVGQLAPLPDNIILITDGLPTQGRKLRTSGNVSGKERAKLFKGAIDELPKGIPVNVILMPLEGDPMAASHFWKLAMETGGSFLSPSSDWP
ncbi:MAG: VWA domain-containing protein [Pseudomonadales bacterium]|nr:hypothetical protein [Pseudomonadales bacterium]MCP5213859.1 VWA domain-containing protein [Pseudomonadales bacterium]